MIGKLMPAMAPALSLRNDRAGTSSIVPRYAFARSITGALSIHCVNPGNTPVNQAPEQIKQRQAASVQANRNAGASVKAISPAAAKAADKLRALAIAASRRPDASETAGVARALPSAAAPSAQRTTRAEKQTVRQVVAQDASATRKQNARLSARSNSDDGAASDLRRCALGESALIRSEILASSRSGWRGSARTNDAAITTSYSRSCSLDETSGKLSRATVSSDSDYGSQEDVSIANARKADDHSGRSSRRASQAEPENVALDDWACKSEDNMIRILDSLLRTTKEAKHDLNDALSRVRQLSTAASRTQKNLALGQEQIKRMAELIAPQHLLGDFPPSLTQSTESLTWDDHM